MLTVLFVHISAVSEVRPSAGATTKLFNRRSRVRAVVTRGSTGLVGQNTSCKVHKVCISLWPTGWDDVRTRAESPF